MGVATIRRWSVPTGCRGRCGNGNEGSCRRLIGSRKNRARYGDSVKEG